MFLGFFRSKSNHVQVDAQFSHTRVLSKLLTAQYRIIQQIFVQCPTLNARSSVINLKEEEEEIYYVDFYQKKEAMVRRKGPYFINAE